MIRWGHGGLFSVSPPSIQRSWNGTIILHIMKQPHENVLTATGIPCACPLNAVLFGGGNRLGHLLGGGTEKRSPCPLCVCAAGTYYSSSPCQAAGNHPKGSFYYCNSFAKSLSPSGRMRSLCIFKLILRHDTSEFNIDHTR
jgi:hypothetical protein